MKKTKELVKGKRYEWIVKTFRTIPRKHKNGLFTGEFDPTNGNALLITKNGEEWSVPSSDLKEYKQ